jgi:hypothetical protein
MKPGWYILLYHDVSWEESQFVRHIGGTCAPDVFRDHVRTCGELGEIVSVDEGFARLQSGRIDSPHFSFWFDDGLAGVRKYAAPILESRGVTGATSLCSRVIDRKEFFWRFKLSYLNSIDASRHLRARLRARGYQVDRPLRALTLDKFNDEVLAIIDALFSEAAPEIVRQDAFRAFETPDGVLDLQKRGWVVANHSAAHYPIGEPHVMDPLLSQFEECEKYLHTLTGRESIFWVFPFDRNVVQHAIDIIREKYPAKVVVLVRNRSNRTVDTHNVLHRIDAPISNRNGLPDVILAAG